MLFLHLFSVNVHHRFLTFDIIIYRSLLWFLFILLLQCYYMYCNLSHYIVIAIVRSDHRREFFGAEQRAMGEAMTGTEQLRISPLASQIRRR